MRSLVPLLLLTLLLALLGAIAVGDGTTPAPDAAVSTTTSEALPIGPGTTSTTVPPFLEVSAPTAPLVRIELAPVASGLQQPLLVTAPPLDERLFVVEKPGRVMVIADGRLLRRPFLDLTDRVRSDGAELGLLGLTFHPQFAFNGRFFVYYSDLAGDTRLVEYRVSGFDRNVADPSSARDILFLDDPQEFHQAGMLQFGADGYLYVAIGDGGGIADQYGHGRDPYTLFGTIVRLDVDNGDPYAIPPENPFVDGGGAPEVWAYGLRNPWRMSIDHEAGMVYIGDVGQFRWEEIDVVPLVGGGYDFGWSIVEGVECLDHEHDSRNSRREVTCDPTGTVPPVVVYDHPTGCAVIGGHVYRGSNIPELEGHYFYGDWCGQWVRSFRYEDGQVVDAREWREFGKVGQILSFGLDAYGELYVATGDGRVLQLVAVRDLDT